MNRWIGTCGLLSLVGSSVAHATFYWASPTGSNVAACTSISSSGLNTNPSSYGTIGRAMDCARTAGDVVNITAGTYNRNEDMTVLRRDVVTSNGPASGTSEQVRTIVQGDPRGARPIIYCRAASDRPFLLAMDRGSRNYMTIRHLVLDGMGQEKGVLRIGGHHVTVEDSEIRNTGSSAIYSGTSDDGIAKNGGVLGENGRYFVLRNNLLHHFGEAGGNGYALYGTGWDTVIENNEIHHVSNYALTLSADNWDVHRAIVRRNYIHDVRTQTRSTVGGHSCTGMAMRGEGLQVYDNIIDLSSGCEGAETGYGIFIYRGSATSLRAFNNLIIKPKTYGIRFGVASSKTHEVYNNIIIGAGVNALELAGTVMRTHNACPSNQNCATSNHTVISSLTDIAASTSQYWHKSGSLGLNKGRDVATRHCNGACDLGPFEAFKMSCAKVASNSIEVGFSLGERGPLLPLKGIIGLTATCTGASCPAPTPLNATRITGDKISIGAVATGGSGQNWVATAAGSNVTDSVHIGLESNGLRQRLLDGSQTATSDECGSIAIHIPTAPGAFKVE